jgi:hypothetical protein
VARALSPANRWSPAVLEVRVDSLLGRIIGLGPFLIPIVAILVGGAIAIIAMIHKHQERIAKIERGIDPDGPWPQQK